MSKTTRAKVKGKTYLSARDIAEMQKSLQDMADENDRRAENALMPRAAGRLTPSTKKVEAEIHLYFCEICVLTVEEFEKMAKAVWVRMITDILEPGDKVLIQLIFEHAPRYCEVKQMKGEEFDPAVMQIAEQYGKIWNDRRLKMEAKRRKGK